MAGIEWSKRGGDRERESKTRKRKRRVNEKNSLNLDLDLLLSSSLRARLHREKLFPLSLVLLF
jgi:hypothetical protein